MNIAMLIAAVLGLALVIVGIIIQIKAIRNDNADKKIVGTKVQAAGTLLCAVSLVLGVVQLTQLLL